MVDRIVLVEPVEWYRCYLGLIEMVERLVGLDYQIERAVRVD